MNSLGRVTILKARMNADLHMATDLKATDKGNLFVIFGEPDVHGGGRRLMGCFRVRVLGVDVFDPSNGRVREQQAGRASPAGSWTRTSNEESFLRVP